ncbi:flagellar biosynthesis anti-sigma factor FlgM [Undibacterium arcticum]
MPIGPAQSAPSKATEKTNAGATQASSVKLSSQVQSLGGQASSGAVFDAKKVDEIKLAISDGQFQVNSEKKVADGLLQTVKDLLHPAKKASKGKPMRSPVPSPIDRLAEEHQAIVDLNQILEQEQAHLIQADIDGLNSLVDEKNRIVARMTALTNARHQSLAAAGYAASDAGMQSWLDHKGGTIATTGRPCSRSQNPPKKSTAPTAC